MFKGIEKHPVISTILAIGGAIAAIGGFWSAFSPEPLIPTIIGLVRSVVSMRSTVAALSALAFIASIGVLVVVAINAGRARRELPKLQEQIARKEDERIALERSRATLNEKLSLAVKALTDGKERWAHERLLMYSGLRFGDGGAVKPVVVVRFVKYGSDYQLAKLIEKILGDFTSWEVTLDHANSPVLPPMDDFKVIFESGPFRSFDKVAFAFSDGNLLGVSVGAECDINRSDEHRLVIKILPASEA